MIGVETFRIVPTSPLYGAFSPDVRHDLMVECLKFVLDV